ncbi:hypothetical protein BDV93DRAFT_516060 [Ceratobasidium sp. AG-I]|nr:hypothetical protein BDV93DRAFT_516060 [Ceratobasidium sp. AG-I]
MYESSTPELTLFEAAVFSHPGDRPKWAFNRQGQLLPGFNHVCTIEVDLTQLSGALTEEAGANEPFWSLEFDVCVRFGGAELEAFLEWKENETTCTVPVVIIPERGLREKICLLLEDLSASAAKSKVHSPKPFQGPWEGRSKIAIGIDVGSTQSGVAFAFLQRGVDQTIHRVTQWPGQEAQNQQSKIPTLVWYDSEQKAVLFGAEALTRQAEEDAEDYSWTLAKHFKLHLRLKETRSKYGLKLDPLPPGVSLRQIYAEFLGYLLQHTKSFFEDRILDGEQIWTQYQPKMEFVIAHPNGWGIREQAFLHAAAVEARFADMGSAPSKIRFVTEAEASVHFCIYHTNLGERLKAGMDFVVCDAGGSTVDTTVYSVASARPVLKLEEKRASACVQAGAIFVDVEAEKYLRIILGKAQLSSADVEEYTKAGMKDFEGYAKRVFRDAAEEQKLTIGGVRFNNSAMNARRGRITLAGPTLKSLFNNCTEEITKSVDQQVEGLNVAVWQIGDFGDSPYLRRVFKDKYEPQGSRVTLTNDSTSKAVADGAVIWRASSNVFPVFRALPMGLSTRQYLILLLLNTEAELLFSDRMGVALDVEATRREAYHKTYKSSAPDISDFQVDLFSYSGDDEPEWATNEQGRMLPGFRLVCVIKADLTRLSGALRRCTGVRGAVYSSMSLDVCICFGGTELEAFLEWKENGATHTGPATIVPENVL